MNIVPTEEERRQREEEERQRREEEERQQEEVRVGLSVVHSSPVTFSNIYLLKIFKFFENSQFRILRNSLIPNFSTLQDKQNEWP